MSTSYYLTVLLFKKKLTGFNNLHKGMPHTYCHHSISLIFAVIQVDIVLTF
jgi:hypothetical protein